ncbi:hypothetical protein GCM10018775_27150 [Streptomyces umbrinus]|nr:hypothetical protein GCM10018775_27150 [Streptomyces umbrinus]
MSGAAIDTIVWSMNVIDTANIIAASASGWEAARPAPDVLSLCCACVRLTWSVCVGTGDAAPGAHPQQHPYGVPEGWEPIAPPEARAAPLVGPLGRGSSTAARSLGLGPNTPAP